MERVGPNYCDVKVCTRGFLKLAINSITTGINPIIHVIALTQTSRSAG